MAQEEQNQRGSTGSSRGGGGNIVGVSKSSKKQKQKKVPQRGLGVAQLERIRIEELKKKDAAAAAAAMAAPAVLRPPPPIPRGTVAMVNPGKSDVLEMGRRAGTIMMHENIQKMWSSVDLQHEPEASAMHSAGLNWNPPCESDQVWSLPGTIPRVKPEYLNQQVNVVVPSAPTSPSQSTLLNLQMEPPSNQNYHYSSYALIVPEVVGMKRNYPFSLEDPNPIPRKTAHHTDRLNESSSGGNRFSHDHETGNLRNEHQESLSFPGSSLTSESNLTRGSRENAILGEVLTLAPPSSSSTWPNPKSMDPPPTLPSNHQNNLLHHESHHLYRGHAEELYSFQQGLRKTGQQHQYYYSFLPPAIPQDTRAEPDSKTGYGEDRECIDLELRL